MKSTRRAFFKTAGLAAVASFLPDAFSESRGLGLEEIWKRAEDLRRGRKVPGMAISVIRDGRELGIRTFGVRNIQENLPVNFDTVFEAASLSKPAFSYCVLQLVQEGKLKLDEPLLPYLAEHFSDDSRAARITTRMVLSHTSGLPHGIPDGTPIRLRFDPGERFSYSATGFILLQRAVAKITGKALHDFMRERLLKPLAMEHSEFIWNERFAKNWAAGYDNKGERGTTYLERFRNFSPAQLDDVMKMFPELAYPPAAAGLYTTASDYARFMIEMISPKHTPFARGSLFEEMFTPQAKAMEKVSWGLGWGLLESNKNRWVWHWGNWNGLSQHFAIVSRVSGDGMVVLTNSGNGLAFCQELLPDVLDVDLRPLQKLLG